MLPITDHDCTLAYIFLVCDSLGVGAQHHPENLDFEDTKAGRETQEAFTQWMADISFQEIGDSDMVLDDPHLEHMDVGEAGVPRSAPMIPGAESIASPLSATTTPLPAGSTPVPPTKTAPQLPGCTDPLSFNRTTPPLPHSTTQPPAKIASQLFVGNPAGLVPSASPFPVHIL